MSSDEDIETTFTIKKKVKVEDPSKPTTSMLSDKKEEGETEMQVEDPKPNDTMEEEKNVEKESFKSPKPKDSLEKEAIEEEQQVTFKNPLWNDIEEEEKKNELDLSSMQATEKVHTEFYTGKKNIEQYERRNLETIPLRNYHNWIKSVLINKYVEEYKKDYRAKFRNYPQLSILDLGCGTGGDLTKWAPNRISYYVGVDVSDTSVKLAYDRWEKAFKHRFLADFINVSGAAREEVFYQNINQNVYFDIVSSQFVIHYMFSKESYVENLFSNISKRLLKGGYFICSIPDADVMVKRIRTKGVKTENDELVLGNQYYSVKFKTTKFPRNQPYGLEYGFFLDDSAVGSKTVDENGNVQITYVPEYLIIPENLIKIAKKYDLELVEEKNFHDFCKESIKNKNFVALMEKLKIEDIGLIPPKLWEISYLYKIMAFKKTSGLEMNENDRDFKSFAGNKVTIQEDGIEEDNFLEENGTGDQKVPDQLEDDLFDS